MTPADLLDTTVADVLGRCPAAARVFFDKRMGCVGCPFAAFETVGDVATVYGADPIELARALIAAGVTCSGEPSGLPTDHSGGSGS